MADEMILGPNLIGLLAGWSTSRALHPWLSRAFTLELRS